MLNSIIDVSLGTFLLGFGLVLGAICFFEGIYRQKRNLLHQIKIPHSKIMVFDILFIFLISLIPFKILLSFDFSILVGIFMVFFSVLDIILYKHIRYFKPWWQYFGILKKICWYYLCWFYYSRPIY